MNLSQLPKTNKRSKKRAGRGYGSGKGGHTVGRGNKGQKARSKVPLLFEGTKAKKSLIKRLPLQRGKGKLKSLKPGPVVVNLSYLNLFKAGDKVNLASLIKKGIVDSKQANSLGVKILGEGELKLALKVELPCSKGAMAKIKKVGGTVSNPVVEKVAKVAVKQEKEENKVKSSK